MTFRHSDLDGAALEPLGEQVCFSSANEDYGC